MDALEPVEAVEAALRAVLARPRVLDEQVRRVLADGFDITDGQQLTAVMAGGDSLAATVGQLLWFPGSDMQQAIEPAVAAQGLGRPEIDRLKAALCRRPPTLHLIFAPRCPAFSFTPPVEWIDDFVDRLNLDVALDPMVVGQLERCLAPDRQVVWRVVLRNGKVAWRPATVDLFCRLLAAGGNEADLELFVRLAALWPPDQSAAEFLDGYRKSCLDQLAMATGQRRLLAGACFEEAAARNFCRAYVDEPAVRRDLEGIDRLWALLDGCGPAPVRRGEGG